MIKTKVFENQFFKHSIYLVAKLSLVLIIVSMNHCISYLYHLGKEQVNIMSKREKLSELLQKPNIDPHLKNYT